MRKTYAVHREVPARFHFPELTLSLRYVGRYAYALMPHTESAAERSPVTALH